jgi:hypothetical protein
MRTWRWRRLERRAVAGYERDLVLGPLAPVGPAHHRAQPHAAAVFEWRGRSGHAGAVSHSNSVDTNRMTGNHATVPKKDSKIFISNGPLLRRRPHTRAWGRRRGSGQDGRRIRQVQKPAKAAALASQMAVSRIWNVQ